jgi:outer membrane protein assembly factor BamD
MCCVLAAGVIAGCGAKLPPADATTQERFEWSYDRYERGKYQRSIRGFRDLLFREPLHPTADSARYFLAESYLQSGEELLAANEFAQLANTRPNSPLADDAQFGVCRAYWGMSPSVPRDQDFTRKAIEECTRLLEFFPRTMLADSARALREDAREKLAEKDLRIGKWYFKRGLYESAIIYLENVVSTYSEAAAVPETLYVLQQSYERVGFSREADAARSVLRANYPDSKWTELLNELESEDDA